MDLRVSGVRKPRDRVRRSTTSRTIVSDSGYFPFPIRARATLSSDFRVAGPSRDDICSWIRAAITACCSRAVVLAEVVEGSDRVSRTAASTAGWPCRPVSTRRDASSSTSRTRASRPMRRGSPEARMPRRNSVIAVARAASVRAFSSAARARLRCTVMSTAAVETRTNAPARKAKAARWRPHELAELVDRAGRAGQDGLVAQVPLDVFGQGQRALVAPARLLLERLQDDGLEVAREGAGGDASLRGRPLAQRHRRLVADQSQGLELRTVRHVVRQSPETIS
jgi:hypothetical protein